MAHSSFRRYAATLTLLTLGVSVFEPMIADVCDADGEGAAWVAAEVSPAGPSSQSTAPTPQHLLHVCHCAHAHVGSVQSAEGLVVIAGIDLLAVPQATGAFEGPSIQPQVRPPIA